MFLIICFPYFRFQTNTVTGEFRLHLLTCIYFVFLYFNFHRPYHVLYGKYFDYFFSCRNIDHRFTGFFISHYFKFNRISNWTPNIWLKSIDSFVYFKLFNRFPNSPLLQSRLVSMFLIFVVSFILGFFEIYSFRTVPLIHLMLTLVIFPLFTNKFHCYK